MKGGGGEARFTRPRASRHHKEPASWGDGKEECLLLPLVEELQQQRRMLRREEAFFHLVRTAHCAKGAGKPPAELVPRPIWDRCLLTC